MQLALPPRCPSRTFVLAEPRILSMKQMDHLKSMQANQKGYVTLSTGCVVYCRVSSKEQEREGFSIPAQQKLLRDYARQQRLTIVHEFTDVETAKQTGRTGFGEMLRFLKSRRHLPHDPGRKDRSPLPQHQGLDDGRRPRRDDSFRQGERGRLERLSLVRQVHARHQGADGEELRRQLERGGQERASRKGRPGPLADRRATSATSTIVRRVGLTSTRCEARS